MIGPGELGPEEAHRHAPGELEDALAKLGPPRHYYAAPLTPAPGVPAGICTRTGCARPASDPVHLPPDRSWP